MILADWGTYISFLALVLPNLYIKCYATTTSKLKFPPSCLCLIICHSLYFSHFIQLLLIHSSSTASTHYHLAAHPQYYPSPHAVHGHPHVTNPPPRTDNTQRKRPKYTRSKTGCMTCRVKKIKVGNKSYFARSGGILKSAYSVTRQSQTACGVHMVNETYDFLHKIQQDPSLTRLTVYLARISTNTKEVNCQERLRGRTTIHCRIFWFVRRVDPSNKRAYTLQAR